MNLSLRNFLQDESGQGMSEYGLVLGVIAVAVIATIVAFREEIVSIFQERIHDLQTRH